MHAICSTCGTQFAETDAPPPRCPICDEVRQYIPPAGQKWTSLDTLRRTHRNAYQRLEPTLLGIGMAPDFAIGQRALLVQSPAGNVLWDCVSLIDQATGAEGRGALLTGDILQVTMDRQFVSFMRSYPNMLPLSRPAVEAIVRAVAPYPYDRLYGAWWDRAIESGAQAAVQRSLERYIEAIERPDPDAR